MQHPRAVADIGRVLERASIGVLGVITAGLALAALAAQPRGPMVAAGQGVRQVNAPSAAALRALRDGARIEVNRALPGDLELLPGVGPTLARRIIERRDAHGPFSCAEDLLSVPGIGPRTLERLRPLLAFATAEAGAAAPRAQGSIMNTTAAPTTP